MIAGEIRPDIMGLVCSCYEGTRANHGIRAPGGSVGSGANALVSSFSTCAMNFAGSMRCRPVPSSLITKRFVGTSWESAVLAAVRRMD